VIMRLLLVTLLCALASAVWAQDITLQAAEYFWDTDPGVGNGIPFSITNGQVSNDPVLLDASTTSIGAHVLYIRYQDSRGVWSKPSGDYVYVSHPVGPADPLITDAEYFWDTDPGEGNGTALSLTPDATEFMLSMADASSETIGEHLLSLRFRNQVGTWSIAPSQHVYVAPSPTEPQPTIAYAEGFVDELGEPGTGFPLLPDDGVYDQTEENAHRYLSSVSFADGQHYAFSRFQDSQGQWSAAARDSFTVSVFSWRLTARSNTSADSVRLSWRSFPYANEYQVHYDSLVTGSFTNYFTVPATDSSSTVATVNPPPANLHRFFEIRAVLPDTMDMRWNPHVPAMK
jgi:hypothetical protein